MTELELERTPQDRRLYALDGVGTLRSEGLFSSSWSAEADGSSWRLVRRGHGNGWGSRPVKVKIKVVVEPDARFAGNARKGHGGRLILCG